MTHIILDNSASTFTDTELATSATLKSLTVTTGSTITVSAADIAAGGRVPINADDSSTVFFEPVDGNSYDCLKMPAGTKNIVVLNNTSQITFSVTGNDLSSIDTITLSGDDTADQEGQLTISKFNAGALAFLKDADKCSITSSVIQASGTAVDIADATINTALSVTAFTGDVIETQTHMLGCTAPRCTAHSRSQRSRSRANSSQGLSVVM